MTIKELRQQARMTQMEFSQELYGIPIRTIQDWEAGKRTPPEYVVKLIQYKIERRIKTMNKILEDVKLKIEEHAKKWAKQDKADDIVINFNDVYQEEYVKEHFTMIYEEKDFEGIEIEDIEDDEVYEYFLEYFMKKFKKYYTDHIS